MEDLVKEFEEEYSEIKRVRKKRNNKEDKKGELLGRYMTKMLYRQDDKRFDEEYWGWLEGNQKKQKGKREKEKEAKEKRKGEQDEEDKMENIEDLYNEL